MLSFSLRSLLAALLAVAFALQLACAVGTVKRDEDRAPVINTGVGATILYPNQTGPSFPPHPGQAAPAQGQPGAAPATQSSQRSGGGESGNVTFIGGNAGEETSHKELKIEPLPVRWAKIPFIIAAYPFVKLYQVLKKDPPPAETPTAATPPTRQRDLQAAHEAAKMEALERELASRGGAPPQSQPSAYGQNRATGPAVAPGRRASGLSIAEELAALRSAGAAGPTPTGPATRSARPAPQGLADQVADRDRDGRPDHWKYRAGGLITREEFDENGDGSVDRTVHYDPETGARLNVEEDANLDGRVDAWTEYRGNAIARRRSDANHDGSPDTWIFYENGELTRQEEDRSGDGFRDRVSYYAEGRLVREEEDRSGDGRADRVTLYDSAERVRQLDEDRNSDGLVDVRSFYEDGRLTRREIVPESDAAPIEQRPRLSATWDTGDTGSTDGTRP